jgi:hypothetical protein
MSKRATVQPAWLDAMLVSWGRASLMRSGWYRVSPMLKSGIPTQAVSSEPQGLSHLDYKDLEECIDLLEPRLKFAVIRAYKPWTAKAIELELAVYGYGDKLWTGFLTEAAAILRSRMEARQYAA